MEGENGGQSTHEQAPSLSAGERSTAASNDVWTWCHHGTKASSGMAICCMLC